MRLPLLCGANDQDRVDLVAATVDGIVVTEKVFTKAIDIAANNLGGTFEDEYADCANPFATLIWQIADLLRGPYRPPQYERVMLPMTVLRRFDCVLAPTKAKVLAEYGRRKARLRGEALDRRLAAVAGQRFHNHSPLDFEKLQGDPDHVAQHLASYVQGFSANVRRIFEYFEFEAEIEKMQEAQVLYLIVSRFRSVDLHPDTVPNAQMGLIFENLIRRFNELANETAGDHFTPREVIRLMVGLLFIDDDALLATPGAVRTLLDPACGTGGMLAEAQGYLRDHHREAALYVHGQDWNKRAFATAASVISNSEMSLKPGGGPSLSGDRTDGSKKGFGRGRVRAARPRDYRSSQRGTVPAPALSRSRGRRSDGCGGDRGLVRRQQQSAAEDAHVCGRVRRRRYRCAHGATAQPARCGCTANRRDARGTCGSWSVRTRHPAGSATPRVVVCGPRVHPGATGRRP